MVTDVVRIRLIWGHYHQACIFVGVILAAFISDKTGYRGRVIFACCAISAVGYALLLGLPLDNHAGRFAGTCLLAAGSNSPLVICLAWLAVNTPGYTYRASAGAWINIFSQVIAISGNQAYQDPPLYRTGVAA